MNNKTVGKVVNISICIAYCPIHIFGTLGSYVKIVVIYELGLFTM